MIIDHMFPLRLNPTMKGNTTQVVHKAHNENSGATFKA